MSDSAPPDKLGSNGIPAAIGEKARRARRKFIRSTLLGAGVLGLSSLGYPPVSRAQVPLPQPPGAADAKDFPAFCVQCGQCDRPRLVKPRRENAP